jgi:hypothetical protein
MIEKYQEANDASPAVRNYMQNTASKMQAYMTKYGAAAFLPLALFALAIGYISLFVMRRFLKGGYIVPLSAIVGMIPILYFGFNLMFIEKRNTAIGNGIIFFTGYPVFYASLIVIAACTALLFVKKSKSSKSHHKGGGKNEN